jgi:RNA polymerase sigma-70 factor (ECF subfamily)
MADVKKLSDEELVELVREKDKEQYRELIERYQDKLLRYANYLVSDDDLAADVVQEALIKAYVNLFGFDTRRKFSSWIYRIVHNEAVNHIRKNKSEVRIDENKLVDNFSNSEESVEEEFERKEAARMLNECMDRLSIKYREPLTLHYIEERTYEEISDIMRIPIGTVGTRINRGKRLLAGLIKRIGIEDK